MTALSLRRFSADDLDWLVDRHADLYARDEGYDASFALLVREIAAQFLDRADEDRESGWVALQDGLRVGSIFCMAEGSEAPDTARLRLFLLEPAARGSGLAQQMMTACLGFARGAGYRRMRLWTHASHVAACKLYAKNGFDCVDSWAERTFGQDVVSQIWERALSMD